MLGRHRGIILLIAALVVVGSWGCDSSNNNITTPSYDPQDVQAGAEVAGIVGPSSEAVQDIIVGLMQGVVGAPAPMTNGDMLIPARQTSVYLENGVSGDCAVLGTGAIECSFSGTTLVNGHAVDVSGTLVANPSSGQPPTGTSWDIDFDAQASSATLGSATWSCLGTLTVDDTGAPSDYGFTMTHTVTPLGGSTVIVNVVLSPSQFELSVTGPMGGTVRINLDRDTMEGMVYVNSRLVATLTIVGDCTNVNFVDDRHQDVSICPQT